MYCTVLYSALQLHHTLQHPTDLDSCTVLYYTVLARKSLVPFTLQLVTVYNFILPPPPHIPFSVFLFPLSHPFPNFKTQSLEFKNTSRRKNNHMNVYLPPTSVLCSDSYHHIIPKYTKTTYSTYVHTTTTTPRPMGKKSAKNKNKKEPQPQANSSFKNKTLWPEKKRGYSYCIDQKQTKERKGEGGGGTNQSRTNPRKRKSTIHFPSPLLSPPP